MHKTTKTLCRLLLSLFTASMLLTGCTENLVGMEDEKQPPVQETEKTTTYKDTGQHDTISASNRQVQMDSLAGTHKSRFVTRRLSSQF